MQITQRRPWATRKLRSTRLAPTRLTLTPGRPETGLRFSEALLIFVVSVATLITSSNPIFGVPLHHSFLNHFALLILAPVFVLHFFGQILNRSLPPVSPIFLACWPILALAVYALTGSAIAKWDYGIDDTYLALGIYLMLLPLYAICMPVQVERVRPWAIGLLLIWVVCSLATLVGESARALEGSLHEIEYLVATGFFALFYVSRSFFVKLFAAVCMVAAFVLNAKLTGYIILSMALLHFLVTWGWRRLPANFRGLYGGASLFFVVTVGAVLTMLYFEFRAYLPSGNPEVRMAQYQTAWLQFLDSPVWGNAFLKGSGEILNASFGRFYIPTHSDLLDILKHGGTIGFVLFMWGYWKVFSLVHAAVKVTKDSHVINAYFTSLRFFIVTAMVTFAINPLLLKGPFAHVIWANLGFGVGLALTVLRQPRPEPAQ
jgi:hypothetical protein